MSIFVNWNHNWNLYENRQRLLHADDNNNGNRKSMFHDHDSTYDFSCRFLRLKSSEHVSRCRLSWLKSTVLLILLLVLRACIRGTLHLSTWCTSWHRTNTRNGSFSLSFFILNLCTQWCNITAIACIVCCACVKNATHYGVDQAFTVAPIEWHANLNRAWRTVLMDLSISVQISVKIDIVKPGSLE